MEHALQELSSRIDFLEKQNRRMKRIGISAMLSLAAALAVGAANVNQSELVLRDPNNNVTRITLNTNPKTGSAGLQIFDRLGRRRILLATEPEDDRPGLFFFDEEGNMKRQDND
jgi:hypothetical protein